MNNCVSVSKLETEMVILQFRLDFSRFPGRPRLRDPRASDITLSSIMAAPPLAAKVSLHSAGPIAKDVGNTLRLPPTASEI